MIIKSPSRSSTNDWEPILKRYVITHSFPTHPQVLVHDPEILIVESMNLDPESTAQRSSIFGILNLALGMSWNVKDRLSLWVVR